MPQGCYGSTDVRVRGKHIIPPRTSVTFKLLVCRCKKNKDSVIMTQLEPGPGLLCWILSSWEGRRLAISLSKTRIKCQVFILQTWNKGCAKRTGHPKPAKFSLALPPLANRQFANVNCFNHPHVANANHSNTNCIQHLKHNSSAGEHCGLLPPSSVKDRQHSATGPASELPSRSAGRRRTGGDLLL